LAAGQAFIWVNHRKIELARFEKIFACEIDSERPSKRPTKQPDIKITSLTVTVINLLKFRSVQQSGNVLKSLD